MKCGAAIAVILAMLTLPALAQRGAVHGGSFGNRGYGGHSSYSGRQGFVGHRGTSQPRGYASAPPFKFGSLGSPPAVRFDPPHMSTPHIGVGQNGIVTSRPAYRDGFAGRNRTWDGHRNGGWDHRRDHDGDHDRDRFHGRARSFENWYLLSSPGWVQYGYPYVADPGFYDESDYDNSGYDQNNDGSAYNNENPDYQPEYPNGEYGEPEDGNGGESHGEPGGSYAQPGEQPPP
ncbi:MAG: hypothetical protein ACRD25_12170, partial [Terracidiphilus sp.]